MSPEGRLGFLPSAVARNAIVDWRCENLEVVSCQRVGPYYENTRKAVSIGALHARNVGGRSGYYSTKMHAETKKTSK